MKITQAELQRGRFTSSRLAEAVKQFKNDGFVALEGCLRPERVAELSAAYIRAFNEKMVRTGVRPVTRPDARTEKNDRIQIDFLPEGGNHDFNRWHMHLPSRRPFFENDVIANPFAMQIVKSVMGPAPILAVAASDTPMPGSGFQNVHQDDSTFRITINVPMVEFREDNGAIEVWRGSHKPPHGRFSTRPYTVKPAAMKKMARGGSERVLVPAGTLIVRDHRLVHRGTPNRSSDARPMLSLYYFSAPREVFPRSLANAFARVARQGRAALRARIPNVEPKLLAMGNLLGTEIEYQAGSDRDDHCPIPQDVWSALNPTARGLLRFAEVEPHVTTGLTDFAAISVLRGLLPLLTVPVTASKGRRR